MPSRRVLAGGAALLIMLAGGCSEPAAAPTPSAPPVVQSASPTVTSAPPTPTPTPTSQRSSVTPTPSTTEKSPSPSPTSSSFATNETGEQTYGTDLALSKSALTYTKLRWYWGKAAQRRCKKQGIKAELAWCNDYYFENDGARVEAKLDSDAEIRLLDDDLKLVPASRAKLNAAIAEATWPHFRFELTGTDVTQIEQVFTP